MTYAVGLISSKQERPMSTYQLVVLVDVGVKIDRWSIRVGLEGGEVGSKFALAEEASGVS